MEEIGVRGLVVREEPFGDHDKILTLITPEKGIITVTAKGARNLKNKNFVACNVFTYSYFLLRKSKKYYYVAETEMIEGFYDLKGDIDKVALGYYVCDVASELSVEGIGDSELLRLTLNTLYAIDQALYPRPQIKAAFEFRAIAVAGFLPDLSCCGHCGKFPEEEYMFLDILNGRVLCKGCRPIVEAEEIAADNGTARIYFIMTKTVIYALQYIVSAPSNKFMSFAIAEDELYLLGKVTENYLCNHVGHGFYTLEFYKELHNYD